MNEPQYIMLHDVYHGQEIVTLPECLFRFLICVCFCCPSFGNCGPFYLQYDTAKTRHLMGLGLLVLNATFNNISAISWWSVLLVEETGVSGENH